MTRPRCTCKNQVTYYGSYYCYQDSSCRKEVDAKWWAMKLRLPRSPMPMPKPTRPMRDRRVRKATRSGVKVRLKKELE